MMRDPVTVTTLSSSPPDFGSSPRLGGEVASAPWARAEPAPIDAATQSKARDAPKRARDVIMPPSYTRGERRRPSRLLVLPQAAMTPDTGDNVELPPNACYLRPPSRLLLAAY